MDPVESMSQERRRSDGSLERNLTPHDGNLAKQ